MACQIFRFTDFSRMLGWLCFYAATAVDPRVSTHYPPFGLAVRMHPGVIKAKANNQGDLEFPATNTTLWQAVHSSPTPLFAVRSVRLPTHWSLAPEKDRKLFYLCGLTLF